MRTAHTSRRSARLWIAGVVACTVASSLFVSTGAASAATKVALNGTFRVTAGSCSGGHTNGTYLRMILPSGTASGPYMSNSDSSCSDQSYTLLRAGTDGGLISGSYQATPSPAFDSKGNAQAGRITAPAQFYGTAFATSSNPVDPQTKTSVARPQIYATGTKLSGDLQAFSVTWNSQYFNQGSPKPNGSYPGATSAVSGTYDKSTGVYSLNWTSQVVGGPFDKFTGLWHLTGTFVSARGGSTGGSSHGSSGSGGSGGSVAGASVTPASGGKSTTTTVPTVSVPPSGSKGTSTTPAGAGVSAGGAAPSSAVPSAKQAAATSKITKTHWQVEWWVILLALLVAVAGFVALGLLGRGSRSGGTGGTA